jgi:hypothetical protein
MSQNFLEERSENQPNLAKFPQFEIPGIRFINSSIKNLINRISIPLINMAIKQKKSNEIFNIIIEI